MMQTGKKTFIEWTELRIWFINPESGVRERSRSRRVIPTISFVTHVKANVGRSDIEAAVTRPVRSSCAQSNNVHAPTITTEMSYFTGSRRTKKRSMVKGVMSKGGSWRRRRADSDNSPPLKENQLTATHDERPTSTSLRAQIPL